MKTDKEPDMYKGMIVFGYMMFLVFGFFFGFGIAVLITWLLF